LGLCVEQLVEIVQINGAILTGREKHLSVPAKVCGKKG